MRNGFAVGSLALAGAALLMLLLLPAGDPATLAPLAAVAILAPLSVALFNSHEAVAPLPPAARDAAPISVPESVHHVPAEPPEPQKAGSVAPFMAENLTRSEGASVAVDDLYEAYRVWCATRGLAALDAEAFADRLGTICTSAGIKRSRKRALINIALAQ